MRCVKIELDGVEEEAQNVIVFSTGTYQINYLPRWFVIEYLHCVMIKFILVIYTFTLDRLID